MKKWPTFEGLRSYSVLGIKRSLTSRVKAAHFKGLRSTHPWIESRLISRVKNAHLKGLRSSPPLMIKSGLIQCLKQPTRKG